MKRSNLLVFFFIGYAVLNSCTSKKYTDKSHDAIYKKENKVITFKHTIVHIEENVSRVFYKFSNDNLVYKKRDSATVFSSNLIIFYRLISEPDSRLFLDTGTIVSVDQMLEVKQKDLFGYFDFKQKLGTKLYLEIQLKDGNNPKTKSTVEIETDKKNKFVRQNYAMQYGSGDVIFQNRVPTGNVVLIKNPSLKNERARVEFSGNRFSLPPPPFSMKEYDPFALLKDSAFSIKKNDDGYFHLKIYTEGLYHLSEDSINNDGLTIYGVGSEYPKVSSHEQMIASTRFILTNDEYKKLLAASDKKKAIDDFWIGIAGNVERARELIRKYYNRVQDANTLFSCFQEGWRTDRGMIYIVFGAPAKVYKVGDREIWEYGTDNAPNSMEYRFDKIDSKYSDNNYFLERAPVYKDPWYFAVNAWRDGRVFSDN